MILDTHSARLLPSVVAPPTVVFNPPGAATPASMRGLPCPNCGARDDKALVLTVDVQLPDNPAKRLHVLRCPACTANFYDSQVPPDYAEPALNNRGRVPFYVQQGAGVSLITRPLAQLRRPPGASYMEVGCGYGFGLDFALNTNGWTGLGIDPAPLAALGRDALQLPIELRYLREDDEARGTIDVVMGSEVIEHVTSPAAFVRTLKAMLRPGGVLILTTPNGDDIDPTTPPGIIIPLLSPSLHLVIQNRMSLTALLTQAGFAHVAVEVDSHSLVAFASDGPLALEHDHGRLRRALRDHLERRAQSVDPGSDLMLAFAGRAFYESVNDGDMSAADRAWALLVPAVQARFGLDLRSVPTLPEALARCSLEEMADLVPLNLGGLLYAQAIRRLAAGEPRASLENWFLRSAEAAAAMRRALGELAMEDGQTEDIGWTSLAEAALCAADARTPDLASRLRDLPPAPNGGERRQRSIALRALATLVNAGELERGRLFARDLGLGALPFAQPGADRTEAERDALYCLAILDSEIGPDGKPSGDPEAARGWFEQIRHGAEPGSGLWWSALRGEMQALGLLEDRTASGDLVEQIERDHPLVATGEWALPILVNLGRYGAARAIAQRSGLASAPFSQPSGTTPLSPDQADIVFSLAVLDGEIDAADRPVGNPALARARFRRVRDASPAGSELWWAALRGETQALSAMGDKNGLAQLVASVDGEQQTDTTARWALPHLVNAGQFDRARAIAARAGLADAAFARPGSTEQLGEEDRSLVFALAVLDAQLGPDGQPIGDQASASGRFRRVRLASEPGTTLWWSALRGEAQALGTLNQKDTLADLAEAIGRDHPELDTAGWSVPILANAGRNASARTVVARSGLGAQAHLHPGSTRPLSPEERDLLFFLALLDAEIGPDGQAVGTPAMARGRFLRVRKASPEGSGLWWAALRGELQALDLLHAQAEAAQLTREVEAAYPQLQLPPDILARIGGG